MDVNTTGGFSIKVSSDDEQRPRFDFGADILADGNSETQMKPKKKKKKKVKKQAVQRQLSAISEEKSPKKMDSNLGGLPSVNEFPSLGNAPAAMGQTSMFMPKVA